MKKKKAMNKQTNILVTSLVLVGLLVVGTW